MSDINDTLQVLSKHNHGPNTHKVATGAVLIKASWGRLGMLSLHHHARRGSRYRARPRKMSTAITRSRHVTRQEK